MPLSGTIVCFPLAMPCSSGSSLPAERIPVEKELKIAILIDAENISSKYASIILQEAASLGNVIYKRIYGDWTTTHLNSWKKVLLENAVQPIQQFSNTIGKNSSDSALIIDAMDLLYQNNLDAFCIVSSDSDFTRLASRLRESQMFVLGMGEKKTPRSFISACNKFSYLDLLYRAAHTKNAKKSQGQAQGQGQGQIQEQEAAQGQDVRSSSTERTKAKEAAASHGNATKAPAPERSKSNNHGSSSAAEHSSSEPLESTKASADADDASEVYGEGSDIKVVTEALLEITEEFSADDGWIISSRLGARLSKRLPDFDTRNFGFRKFVPFVESLKIFESKSIVTSEDTGVRVVYFRLIEE